MLNLKEKLDYLTREGYKVKTTHRRLYKLKQQPDIYLRKYDEYDAVFELEMCQKGGLSEVVIIDPETGKEYEGVANCSVKDQFSRKVGRMLAFERALEEFKAAMNPFRNSEDEL